MPKLTEYPEAQSFDENDILIKDGVNGTKKIKASNAADYMGKNVIMVNEDPTPGTKVVLETTDEEYELALMSDVNSVAEEVDDVKTQLMENNEYRLYDGNQTLKVFSTRTAARTDVPSASRKIGLTIIYKLTNTFEDRIIRETFRGTNVNTWTSDQWWDEIEVPNLYWGHVGINQKVFLKNYVKAVLCSKSINLGLRFSWTTNPKAFGIYATSHNNDESTSAFIGKKLSVEISSFESPNNYTVIQLDKYNTTDPDIYVIVDTYRLSTETITQGFATMPASSIAGMNGGCIWYTYLGESDIDNLKSGLNTVQTTLSDAILHSNIYRLNGSQAGSLERYATRTLARNAVPSANRKSGLIISYYLSNSDENKVIVERFDGGVNNWSSDNFWKDFDANDIYWGSIIGNDSHIENYVKNVICDTNANIGLQFKWINSTRTIEVYATLHDGQTATKFIGKKLNISVDNIVDPTTRYAVELEKYADTDPRIVVVLDIKRMVTETIGIAFSAYASTTLVGAFGSCVHREIISKNDFDTVFEAAQAQKLGAVKVGQIMMNGNSLVNIPASANSFVTKPFEDAFTPMEINDLYPLVKKAVQKRVTVDNVKMYLCSVSERHIFFSASPTSNYKYESIDEFNTPFMAYADKNDLDNIIKIDLPSYLDGAAYLSRTGRRKYIYELSDGSVLLEVENGQAVSTADCQNNLYRIENLFEHQITDNTITVTQQECVLVNTFVRNASLARFHNIEEYAPGHIIMAPYGGGATATIYISHNYGQTWEIIFCGITSNEVNIPVKAQALGVATAAGEWPTPAKVIPANSIDWTKTTNGNIHVHGIAYDRWYDRIWACTGDGGNQLNSVTGIWYTDDFGLNWHRIETRGEKQPFYQYGTQMIGVVPMDNAVLFGTDGQGDGFYRWSRSGKDRDVAIEPCYQYTGSNTGLTNIGQDWCRTKDGFIIHSFSPDHNIEEGDYKNRGGLVASYNGYSFVKIYVDEFTDTSGDGQLAYDTHEISWGCHITEGKDHTLITSARQGGYLLMYL